MAKDLKVKVKLEADTQQATTALGKFKSTFGSISAGAAGLGIGLAAVGVAIGKVTENVREWITAANVQEDAVASLDAQLRKLGPAADGVSAALQAQAAALQLVTRFGDEVTIAAQAQLATFAGSEEGIKALTVAAQDFATAQGIDLVGAAKLLGKTLGSSTNALIRYGIEVEGAAGSTERLDSLTSNIAALFAGRAVAAANTYSGVMERLANAQGDVNESLGEAFTKSESLKEAQRGLAVVTEGYATALKQQGGILPIVAEGWARFQTALKQIQIIGTDMIVSVLPGVTASTDKMGNSVEEAAKKQAAAAEQAKQAAAAAQLLATAQDEAAAAATKLGNALGEVTSSELEGQILTIKENLELARGAMDPFGDEFVRLEEIARVKMESLGERILNLKDGLGDLKQSTTDAGTGMEELGSTFGLAGERARTLGSEVDTLTSRFDRGTQSASQFAAAAGAGNGGLFSNLGPGINIGGTLGRPVVAARGSRRTVA